MQKTPSATHAAALLTKPRLQAILENWKGDADIYCMWYLWCIVMLNMFFNMSWIRTLWRCFSLSCVQFIIQGQDETLHMRLYTVHFSPSLLGFQFHAVSVATVATALLLLPANRFPLPLPLTEIDVQSVHGCNSTEYPLHLISKWHQIKVIASLIPGWNLIYMRGAHSFFFTGLKGDQ